MSVRVQVILDESGSMGFDQSLQEATMSGFNNYMRDLKQDVEIDYLVSLTKFNTAARVEYTDIPVKEVPNLDWSNYTPAGGTALYDAIAKAVAELEPRVKYDRVIV